MTPLNTARPVTMGVCGGCAHSYSSAETTRPSFGELVFSSVESKTQQRTLANTLNGKKPIFPANLVMHDYRASLPVQQNFFLEKFNVFFVVNKVKQSVHSTLFL